MDLTVELTEDGVAVNATSVHPIDTDTAVRVVTEIALNLHRALSAAE